MLSPELITNVQPDFWQGSNAESKQHILGIVVNHADADRQLNQPQWTACLKTLKKEINATRNGPLSDKQHKLVCQVLSAINRTGLLRCVIPPAPIKATRPSVLPDNPAQWSALEITRAYRKHVNQVLRRADTSIDRALVLFYELVWLGYALEPAVSILSRLRQGDLSGEGAVLRTPVHYLDSGTYTHETLLPSALCDKFQKLGRFNLKNRHVAGRYPEQQWAIHLPGLDNSVSSDSPQHQKRFDTLKQALTERHSELYKAWAATQSERTPLLARLGYFSRSLRLNAFANGLEPVFYNQLATLPLPADTPQGLRDFLVPSHQLPLTVAQTRTTPTPNQPPIDASWDALAQVQGRAVSTDDICETLSAHWALDGKFLLREFLSNLINQFGTKRLTKGQLPVLEKMIAVYLVRASQIAPQTSVITLGLLWIASKLHAREIAVSTAKDYTSAIILNGLLDYEAAYDLSDWDDEDVEAATGLIMNRRRLSDSTRSDRQDRVGQFFNYCRSNQLLEEVHFEKEKFAYTATKRRNIVLGLAEFDELQHKIAHSAAPQSELVNTLLTLGFYGGLRAGEMLGLSLEDIQYCGPEIYICVRRGKTVAARRKIPLHLIAPPRVCGQFRHYLENRLALAKREKANRKKVAFVGPEDSIDGFDRQAIMPPVINLLRYYTNKKLDLHTLRHGFGTWLMLRAHALKYPDFKEQLLEQEHAVFSEAGEKRLTQLFQWNEDEPLNKDKIDLFIHIRKVIGHSHISVLMQNYMHGFGAIHQHWLKRLAEA